MLQTRVVQSLVLLGTSIVVPGNLSVNLSSFPAVHVGHAAKQWSDGSPMPIPKPKGEGGLVADGSPMPIAKPKGDGTLVADGSPMPIPKPKGGITQLV
jgi:hypothetical protein